MKITELMNSDITSDLYSESDRFSLEVLQGLSSKIKNISPMYFYDDKGSELFQKITQHEDYYLTRTEYEILNLIKNKLPELINVKEIDIIELGVGDGHKSEIIIDGFLSSGTKVNFYPIDISKKALELLEENIKSREYLTIHGIVAEYFEGLKYVTKQSKNKQLTLFLGSNIGNFDLVQSQKFLRHLWMNLNANDYAIIGFDLKKDISVLNAAYNDSAGHTRDFNLNLLDRINTELGGNFDTKKFQHFGSYNPMLGAMESYLLSLEEQDVSIDHLGRVFHFKAYEPIHIEYSFKFLEHDIDFLSKNVGFKSIKHYTDDKNYFIDSLWEVVK